MDTKSADDFQLVAEPRIGELVVTVRGRRVLIDTDLARLYGTKTKRLKEQIRRNADRFPEDFMFQLSAEEAEEVVANCGRLKNIRFSSVLPMAFTERGAVMAANVLNSQIAIDASILVVRAFICAREILAEHLALKRRLDVLECKVARGFHENEEELQAIRSAIHQLMQPDENSGKKPIGFGREA